MKIDDVERVGEFFNEKCRNKSFFEYEVIFISLYHLRPIFVAF